MSTVTSPKRSSLTAISLHALKGSRLRAISGREITDRLGGIIKKLATPTGHYPI
jgi:hypothetical protein